ncbi:MAG TPA: FecR domain-containing protein [Chitinophaga sp.]
MAIKDYAAYTAQELALDERFQEWVLHPENSSLFWEQWRAAHPEKEVTIQQAMALVRGIGFKPYALGAAEKDQLWEALWEHIGEEEQHPAINITTTIKHTWYKNAWKYAATLLLGISATAGWMRMHPAQRAVPVQTLALRTAYGEKQVFYLPDSTEVTMNANTRLLYTATDTGRREVWLDGEAYFKVKHAQGQRPFSVHTYDNVSVTVLGTAFNINSIGKQVKVVLEEGCIRLALGHDHLNNHNELYLRPGEMLTYNKTDGQYSKAAVLTSPYMAWKKGRLEMDNYNLGDAAVFMQQVFGQHLVVSDKSLLQRRISGSMPIVYNADTMLMQLSRVFKVKAGRSGDDVWISGR